MFYLAIVNKVLRHCHSWLARQYIPVYSNALQTTFIMETNPGQTAPNNASDYLYISIVGSAVVECLTRDRGAVGSSLTGLTGSCP